MCINSLLFEKLLLSHSKIRHDEVNSRVSKFCISAKKKIILRSIPVFRDVTSRFSETTEASLRLIQGVFSVVSKERLQHLTNFTPTSLHSFIRASNEYFAATLTLFYEC